MTVIALVFLKKYVDTDTFLHCFDAVGWVIWPVKIVPEMTYKVSSGTLNLCSLTILILDTLTRKYHDRLADTNDKHLLILDTLLILLMNAN